MLKTLSRTRSEVGRVSSPFGAWIVWPLRVPAMIRTRASVGRDGVAPPRPSQCYELSGSPVSSSVFMPLRMYIQPPATFSAVFGARSSWSCTTVSFETPPS